MQPVHSPVFHVLLDPIVPSVHLLHHLALQEHIPPQSMPLTHPLANPVHLVLFLQQHVHQVPPPANLVVQDLFHQFLEHLHPQLVKCVQQVLIVCRAVLLPFLVQLVVIHTMSMPPVQPHV